MPTAARTLIALTLLATTLPALGHFPWVYADEQGRARLFFGEGPDDRDYHLPEAFADAALTHTTPTGEAKQTPLQSFEEEGFVGLRSAEPVAEGGRLAATLVYGAYHGSKLTYYAQHDLSTDPAQWESQKSEAAMQARLARDDHGLAATLTWRGEPLGGATATLRHASGGEGVSAASNAEGVVRFASDALKPGLNALLVMHTDGADSGEVGGEPYTSATHVLTATFEVEEQPADALPALPEPVASFGAAVADGWVYVYSGHTGTAHDHSRDNLSKRFVRAPLEGAGGWEELTMGPPLQGLALVSHGGKLYRVGGLDARNPAGEEEDMHSVDSFACYDPATGAWTDLAPLPAGRSSHNAVVLGDTLYVAGGWGLSGDSSGEWRAGALAFDLTDPDAGWRALPEPPFKRRALAVSHADGRLAVLCGMDDGANITQTVFFFDPAAGAWSEGPGFPGEPFDGFGLAAWNEGGRLYAGGMEGVLYRLAEDHKSWVEAGRFATPRFFHQLLPDGQGGLLAIGGASPEAQGHVATTERIVPADPEP